LKRTPVILLRGATVEDAPALDRFVARYLAEGRLLPRTLADLEDHADRFIVATVRRRIVGCGELAPLSHSMAEVRSLVVDRAYRGRGLGGRIIEELFRCARQQGYDQLCAFVHDRQYFSRLGFSVVPHARVPEKIETDCRRCPLFGRCGQYAMIAGVERTAIDTPSIVTTLRV
jgi:amino-acid N-acetyltransferase